MENELNKTTRDKPALVELVDRLPEVAVRDKIIFNKQDKSFYIGKDDKEEK